MVDNHIHDDEACPKDEGISRELPDLPLDILHHIFARTDPITVVRCAAASKLLRRHITNPSFHQHLRNNHHGEGFVPVLLVGMFFKESEGRKFVPWPPSAKLTLSLAPPANVGDYDNCGLYRSKFQPVASRAGPVVLRRYRGCSDRTTVVDLCVGNPVTGDYALLLPPATVLRTSYPHVLLTGDEVDGPSISSFRLLDRLRRTGPHANGRLALLVAESLGIAMWTLSKDSTSWARRLVVDRQRILGSVKLHCHPLECAVIQLEWFGQASGTVAFQMHGVGILLVNLQTREIGQISQDRRQNICRSLCFFPYEIDLVSVLAAMKSF
ncbi:hypothetical protein HU200_038990 [Digitaria exilis]|uniref:F-box domain-containing protein n=1 Tax=Digitaria exilis TaxID=1010633 RepID=A0A835ELI8_9POAL|nr:hypothetical protein HU200_038990 [Digitaria exilis]